MLYINRLVLDDNGAAPFDGTGIIPRRGSVLRVVLRGGAELALRRPRLMSNYPPLGLPFRRDTFYLVAAECVYSPLTSSPFDMIIIFLDFSLF